MTITLKKLAVIIGIIFALIFIANYLIMKSVGNMRRGAVTGEDEPAIVKNDLQKKNKKIRESAPMRPWKEIDAEKAEALKKKFGIKTRPRNYGPSTPDEWSGYVEKKIANSRMFENEGGKAALGTIQVTAEEYEETMRVNKDHEAAVKKLLDEDPLNKDYKERLQNIYKLQAIGKALKNKIVVENGTAVAQELR